MADPMIYTSPDTVQRDWRYGSDLGQQALVGQRNTNRWSPLANALMGIAGGMHRNFARDAEANNIGMETGAMQAATGAGSNMAAAQALMQSGVPSLQKHGLGLMAQARNQAASDARSDRRLAMEQQRYNDGAAMRDVQLETARANLERLRRGDQQAVSEFEQRRQQAQAVGLDPATPEGKMYLLTGKLPDSLSQASEPAATPGSKVAGGLEKLARVPDQFGAAFDYAVGPIQGEGGMLTAPFRWLSDRAVNLFTDFTTREVRDQIAADSAALSATVKGIVRQKGEGTWTDKDQELMDRIVGDLSGAKNKAEYNRRLQGVKQRVESNFGVDLPEIPGLDEPSGGDGIVDVTTAEERARLAPGTRYRAPDGSVRVAR